MPFHLATAPRILLLEDEAPVALLLEDMLEEAGCVVAASVARIDEALKRIEAERFDAAILDVNIGGETSWDVADALRRQGVPFVFSTGYGSAGMKPEYRSSPVLQKPFGADDLERALRRLFIAAV